MLAEVFMKFRKLGRTGIDASDISYGLWGMSGFPILESPARPRPGEPAAGMGPKHQLADAHLRSTQAVKGYHLQASDGIIGHVADFMMDNESWAIGELVIKTGNRFTGKEVRIPASSVKQISYEESTVFVNLTKEAVEQSPEHHLVPAGAAEDGRFIKALV